MLFSEEKKNKMILDSSKFVCITFAQYFITTRNAHLVLQFGPADLIRYQFILKKGKYDGRTLCQKNYVSLTMMT